MKKIALIDKCPNKNRYKEYFDFDFEHFHLCSTQKDKVLKADVDLEIDVDLYDLVILVGSEAAKYFAKVSSVTNVAGSLINDKFICIINPAMLIFKPEGKNDFERCLNNIKKYLEGTLVSGVLKGDFKGIEDADEAYKFLQEVYNSGANIVALDTETTTLYPRDGHVIGVSLSYKLDHGRYISTDVMYPEHVELLQKIVDKTDVVFHNMKFDWKMLNYHLGIKFRADHVHDTMAQHYSLDETQGSHGLKLLAQKYTDYGDYEKELGEFIENYCKEKGIKREQFTYDLIPFNIISKYASIDTAVTLALHNKFMPIIQKNPNLLYVYNNILIPGTIFLMEVEEVGIPIDRERLNAAESYLDEWMAEAKKDIWKFPEVAQFEKHTGKIFNPNSVIHIRQVLFDYLKLPSTGKLTKTGATSTDAEVLEELSEIHPFPAALLKLRQLGKIKSSYVSKILPELDRDQRIRTNFNLLFTTSGRLSSSGKFNAQQIPRDDPIIKGCIKAPKGYKIVSQDLTTAEMYYAAVLSNDKNLQQVFIDGGDFHSSIAKMVFKLKCVVEEVKKLFPLDRQAAKAVSFGILYGSGANKVADTVNKEGGSLEVSDAKAIIAQYFDTFKGLKKWLADRKTFISTHGFTYSFFGRKRRLLNVFSSDKGTASHEIRSGINMEIQSLASDINLLAGIDTMKEVKKRKLDANIFMLVHDSIVAVVADKDVEEYCQILKECTQKDRGCSIPGCPIGVDQEVGEDYSFGKFEKNYELKSGNLSRISTR